MARHKVRSQGKARKQPGRARVRTAGAARPVDLASRLAELVGEEGIPCSRAAADELAEEAHGVGELLRMISDRAQLALEEWPDARGTSELRTVLLDTVETAEGQARRWQDLARRFEALAEGPHLHLVEDELVAVEYQEEVIETESNEIRY